MTPIARTRTRSGLPAPDYVLLVTIRDTSPAVWRRLAVPSSFTFEQLHKTLQFVFGWLNYHLYEFEVGGRRFESPHNDEAEGEDSTTTRLVALAPKVGDVWLYRYDFGDDWEHDIVMEEIRPASSPPDERWPTLLDGARAGPPEDCGGTSGLIECLDALARPRTKAGRAMRDWVGPHYDPARFDVWHVERALTFAAAYGAI